MKKSLTALLAATILLVSTTFANTVIRPSQQVLNEFNHLFNQPTDVKWEEVSSLYKVTFLQDGQYLTAFFNPTGKIESVSRNISTATLPLILQKQIRDKLPEAWVTECFELLGENGTEYYITLENADNVTVYHSSNGDWDIYKRTKK